MMDVGILWEPSCAHGACGRGACSKRIVQHHVRERPKKPSHTKMEFEFAVSLKAKHGSDPDIREVPEAKQQMGGV